MEVIKQHELLKAADALQEAMDVVYDHAYYGLQSTLSKEDQEPLDGPGGCMFKVDSFYEDLHGTLDGLRQDILNQLKRL